MPVLFVIFIRDEYKNGAFDNWVFKFIIKLKYTLYFNLFILKFFLIFI